LNNKYRLVFDVRFDTQLSAYFSYNDRITLSQLDKQNENLVQLKNEKLEIEKELDVYRHNIEDVSQV
jgi:hypothetical protein